MFRPEKQPVQEDSTPSPDIPSTDVPSRQIPLRDDTPRGAVPRRTWLWLIIALLSLGFTTLVESASSRIEAKTHPTERGPSANEFRNATSGEAQTRIAIAFLAFQAFESTGTKALANDINAAIGNTHGLLKEAIKTYRETLSSPSPNIPRRIFILEHLDGRPLNESLLTRDLVKDLRDAKTSKADIDGEIALWRSLYGKGNTPLPADAEARILKMNLRLLGTQALIDLYERRNGPGDEERAHSAQAERNQSALWFFALMVMAFLLAIVAFIVGICVLIYFVQAAIRGRLDTAGKVEPTFPMASYGDLIDVFAFYFAAFELSRIVLGLLFSAALGNSADAANTTLVLLLELVGYLTPHGIAAVYLANMLRRNGLDGRSVGFTTENLAINILYGILGYCAALPLMWILGILADAIFRHNTDVTPNPAMSLLAAKEDIFGRFLLFVLVSLAAPLCEELFFRGVLVGGLRRRFSMFLSIGLSSVAFALGHPIQDWLPILGLGIAFGTMRDMRQSLVPSMTAHFLQNSITFISLSVLFGGN